jgi:hypothetical protein
MRILAVDCGFQYGYAVLERGYEPRSGSVRIEGSTGASWGKACRSFARKTYELIAEFRPTVVAHASPFCGTRTPPAAMQAIMTFPSLVDSVCDELGIRCVEWPEARARQAFLGKNNMPAGRKKLKAAIIQACRDRGWPCVDDHAGDALCIAAYTDARLNKATAHETTPLFEGSRT